MKLGCDWRRSRNPTLQWKSLRRGCHTSRTSCMLCWEGAGSQAAGAAALLPTQPAPPGTSAFSRNLESPGDLVHRVAHLASRPWRPPGSDPHSRTPPFRATLLRACPHSQDSFADRLVSVLCI